MRAKPHVHTTVVRSHPLSVLESSTKPTHTDGSNYSKNKSQPGFFLAKEITRSHRSSNAAPCRCPHPKALDSLPCRRARPSDHRNGDAACQSLAAPSGTCKDASLTEDQPNQVLPRQLTFLDFSPHPQPPRIDPRFSLPIQLRAPAIDMGPAQCPGITLATHPFPILTIAL
jgi:hypothetical protein